MLPFDREIERIQDVIGYRFRDLSLLRQAFTRESYCNEARQRGDRSIQSNEVLEFCGDSVLSAAIVSILMEGCSVRTDDGMLTRLDEGDFSIIKSNLTNKTMLGQKMKETGLYPLLLVGYGDRQKRIWEEPSVREDLFESIIGAIWFDSDRNMETVIGIVRRLLDTDEYLKKHSFATASPKNALQEWCESRTRRGTRFSYEKIGESGPEHDKTYTVRVTVMLTDDTVLTAEGQGRNVKRAESEAAAAILPILYDKEGV